MRRIQKTQLSNLGINDVVEAANGKDALVTLREHMPIQVILLDWNMPVMDGMAFLKAVREDGAFNDVKIIMCTSEAEKSRVVDAMKAGAANYIIKPFKIDTLKSKLGL